MVKISVIIPVYGVEKYMERAARSLFGQTLDDIEFIFVDDCTPDASMSVMNRVLEDYPERKPFVRQIKMPVNSKQAACRSVGMKAASGRYMIQFDPDDYIDRTYLQDLYDKAVEDEAQICTAAISYENKQGCRRNQIRFIGNGVDALMADKADWHLVAMLIDTEFVQRLSFYPFQGINCGEDVNVAMRVYRYAKRVTYVDSEAVYHYNLQNDESITHNPYRENLDKYLRENVRLLDEFFAADGNIGRRIMNLYKYRVKVPLWSIPGARDIDLWYRLWPESNHILAEKFKTSIPLRLVAKLPASFSFVFKLYMRYIDLRTR